MKILYMTYDGILDPVGQSQVIPYLSGLAKRGVSITLISFEKKDKWKLKDAANVQTNFLAQNKVKWVALRYHKKPIISATCFDILHGFLIGLFLVWYDGIQIIHARGYVTGLMAWFIKKIARVRLLFDMRGFWADEKVDARAWFPESTLYRLTKYLERVFISGADEVVVLTEKARGALKTKFKCKYVSVIPCCVDLELFKSYRGGQADFNLPHRFIVTYLGSVGTFYQFEEMVYFFSLLQEKITNALFLVITNGEPQQISEVLGRYSLKSQDFLVTSLPYHQVPEALKYSKISLIFYHRPLSGLACCPIKFGESLACGVPVIINAGIGDCDRIAQEERVGVVVKEYTKESYEKAIESLQELLKEGDSLRQRCRKVAQRYFSLEMGVERYLGIYQKIMEPKGF